MASWKFPNKLSWTASLKSNLYNSNIFSVRTNFCIPPSILSLLFERLSSKTLRRIVKRGLNSFTFKLWKSISYFFLKEASALQFYKLWMCDLLPMTFFPLLYAVLSKAAKSCVSRKINMEAKRTRSDRSLKLK